MFDSQKNQPKDSMATNMLNTYDEFTEFNDYCSFLCDAFASIVSQEEIIDEDTIRGLRRCSSWMKHRAQEIKAELKEIQQRAAGEVKNESE